ncbi:MAG: hypothetical protein LIP01_09395, partial [Tannerellaceae bacterium]|nr:hypothetical protein [Tannerellaceae bacterium]
ITVLFCSLFHLVGAQEARYGIKSASIEREASAMGQKMQIEWYFDDYGNKEVLYTTLNLPALMGGDRRIMVLTDGDRVTTVDLDEKQGTAGMLPEEPINFLSLSPEAIQKYQLKEAGEETVAGKPCKVYTLKREEMGVTVDAKVWIWEGLQMKSEASSGGMTVYSDTVARIRENEPVPTDKFTIPSDIKGL